MTLGHCLAPILFNPSLPQAQQHLFLIWPTWLSLSLCLLPTDLETRIEYKSFVWKVPVGNRKGSWERGKKSCKGCVIQPATTTSNFSGKIRSSTNHVNHGIMVLSRPNGRGLGELLCQLLPVPGLCLFPFLLVAMCGDRAGSSAQKEP